MLSSNAAKNWGWVILTLLFWSISLNFIPEGFRDTGGDSAQYIILSESIARGSGFRMLNYPQEPFCFYYPPVFPLLILPVIYFLKRNFYWMHLSIIFLGYLSLFFIFNIFKRYTDKAMAFVLICFVAMNWAFILYSAGYILSDIPYLFFSAFSLVFALRYLKKESIFNKEGLLLVLGIILSYFTRYIGLTLFLGVIMYLLLSKNRSKIKKSLFVTGSFLFVFVIWKVFEFLSSGNLFSHASQTFLINPYAPYKGSVLSGPLSLIFRFSEGVNYYYDALGRSFFLCFLWVPDILKELLFIFVILMLSLGIWFKSREDKGCIFQYYVLFYLLVIIFWPFKEGIRLLLPVLPFLFFYFLSGLKKIFDLSLKKYSVAGFYFFVAILFVFNGINLSKTLKDMPAGTGKFSICENNFILMHQWIKNNLPSQGVILSRKPSRTYFYTNNKTVMYPFVPNPGEIWSEVLKQKVKYIIVDECSQETFSYLLPFLYKYENNLILLNRIGNTGLFEVKNN